MLDREKVITALEQKRVNFQAFSTAQQSQRRTLEEALQHLFQQDADSILAYLAAGNELWPGARPTAEFDRSLKLRLPFDRHWTNHREARDWALHILLDRPVLAVDGSQIMPSKDFFPPVGAVQIGWFINEHRQGGGYVKNVEFTILAPDELADTDTGDSAESGFPNPNVNCVRFVRECAKIGELMADYAHRPVQERPLCYFDGSFVISFVGQMHPRHAQPYLRAVQELLENSERYQVPLVGFVDNSFSHDIIRLIETLLAGTETVNISDAGLLARLLPDWGDRSPFFECARKDALNQAGRAPFYRDVVFAYLRLTGDRPPARVEMPRWLLEAGRADEIIDLVRAECIVGANGYPYVIETADAVAVISQEDRQRFYALFQRWGEDKGLQITQARKALSKQGRR